MQDDKGEWRNAVSIELIVEEKNGKRMPSFEIAILLIGVVALLCRHGMLRAELRGSQTSKSMYKSS